MSCEKRVMLGGEQLVQIESREGAALVRLEDPERLNALSAGLVRQLRTALERLTEDPEIRTVILTGADPGFSAGGDFRMMDETPRALAGPKGSTDIWRWIRREFGGIARLIAGSDTAFIAAINGPAAGVGLAWALNCDITIASDRALIVPAFGRLGLVPEVGTSWALTRRLGYQGAFAYYVSGENLDAKRALELGLVHEVVPHDELLVAAETWRDKIAELPRHAIAMAKPPPARRLRWKLGVHGNDGGVRRAQLLHHLRVSRGGQTRFGIEDLGNRP